jgi:DNA-binding CsgD family transcriptional regulator
MTMHTNIREALRPLGDLWDSADATLVTERVPAPKDGPPRPLCLFGVGHEVRANHSTFERTRAVNILIESYNGVVSPKDRLDLIPQTMRRTRWQLDAGPKVGKEERFRAAEDLAECFPRPVDPRRWREVHATIKRDADEHDRPVEEEFRQRRVSAAFEVLTLVRFAGFLRIPNERDIRTALNRIMTEDALGDLWHRQERHDGFDEDDCPVVREAHAEMVEIASAVEQAQTGMTPRELEVLSLYIDRPVVESDDEIAEILGMTIKTLRVHHHNILGKIRASI